MVPQQDTNRFFVDASHYPTPNRLLGNQSDRPAGPAIRRMRTDHGNDQLGLAFVQETFTARTRIV